MAKKKGIKALLQDETNSPQYNAKWPGAIDILKQYAIVDYDEDMIEQILLSLPDDLPYVAQWVNSDIPKKTKTIQQIVDSPEFVAVMRMGTNGSNSFSEEEKLAMVLNASEVDKIGQKEFDEYGDNGITGKYLKINKLVAYWKSQEKKRTRKSTETEDPMSKEEEEYLDSVNIPVTEIEGFQYNEFGVCINPNVVLEHVSPGKISYRLEVSKTREGWAFGYEFNCNSSLNNAGCSTAGSFLDGPHYMTMNDAILAGCFRLFDTSNGFLQEVPQLEKQRSRLTPLQNLRMESAKSIRDEIGGKDWTIIEPRQVQLIKTLLSSQPTKKSKMSKPKLQVVKVADIVPSTTNALHRESWELEDKALQELADSISKKGVLQPVLLRPNGSPGKFYLVCGERRLKASQLAGLDEIPAFIRDLSEEEAFDAQITENLQRKDVHPMKEAQSYKALIDLNPDKNSLQELALRFGKSPEYIAQRLSFNNLIDEMKQEFLEGKIMIGHAIAFARLQPKDQQECLKLCKVQYGADSGHYQHIKAVNAIIEQKLIREIKDAIFNPNDDQLVPGVVSCNDCLKRSGAGNLLFTDMPDGRCMDGACYELKTATYLIAKIEELRENNPEAALVANDYGATLLPLVKKHIAKNKLTVLKKYNDYQGAAKSDNGSIRALVVAGSELGELIYIKPDKKSAKDDATSAKSAVAKNTPEHYDELIAGQKSLLTHAKVELQNDINKSLVDRVFDLKPFVEVDPTPLSQQEKGLFYRLLVETFGIFNKKIIAAIKAIPAPKELKGVEAEAHKWANLSDEIIAAIVRSYISDERDYAEEANTIEGVLFRQAYGSWKGANLDKITKDAEAQFQQKKAEIEQKIFDYQAKKRELQESAPKTKTAKSKK